MAFAENYVPVAERMTEFFAKYPEGSLQPVNRFKPFDIVEIGNKTFVVYTAAAYRHAEDTVPGVGIAWEPFPGPTQFTRDSELQNAETSAWGRAILAVGAADARRGIASQEEVRNRSEHADDRPESAGHPAHTERVCSVCGEPVGVQPVKRVAGKFVHVACAEEPAADAPKPAKRAARKPAAKPVEEEVVEQVAAVFGEPEIVTYEKDEEPF